MKDGEISKNRGGRERKRAEVMLEVIGHTT